MKSFIAWVIAALALAGPLAPAGPGSAEEVTLPLMIYRTGPFAPGGSGIGGGMEDYLALVNAKGGLDGITFKWEECETAASSATSATRTGPSSSRRSRPVSPTRWPSGRSATGSRS